MPLWLIVLLLIVLFDGGGYAFHVGSDLLLWVLVIGLLCSGGVWFTGRGPRV